MMNGSLQMSPGYRAISDPLDCEQQEDNEQYGSLSPPHSSTSSSSSEEDDEILSSPTSPPRSPSPPPIYIYESDFESEEPNPPSFNIFSDYTYASHTSNLKVIPYYEIPSPQRPSLHRDGKASTWNLSLDDDDDDYKDENEQEDEDKENWVEKEMLWRLVRKPRPLRSFYMRWVMRQQKEYVGQQERRERRIVARNRWRRKVLEGKKGWEMTQVEEKSKLGL